MDRFKGYEFLNNNIGSRNRVFVLGSANGSGNLGDEAMFESLTGFYYHQFPEIKITTDVTRKPFVSAYKNVDKQIPMYGVVNNYRAYIKLIEYFGLKFLGMPFFHLWKAVFKKSELLRYYKEFLISDYIVFSGAGAINSRFNSYGIYGWGTLVYLAKRMNKKVYFTGHGIGPFNSKIDGFIAVDFLKKADHIKCRDEKSYKFLFKKGIKKISWGIDDAYYIDLLNTDEKNELFKKNEIYNKYIVLSFHAWNKNFNDNYFFLIASYILQNTNRDVVLLGNKIKPTMNDIPTLQAFKERYFANNSRVKVLIPPYTPQASKTLITNSDLLITTRYHPAIFSGEYNIPTVSLSFDDYYYQKFEGAFAGRSNVVNLMYDNSISEISPEIEQLLNNLPVN